MFNFATEEHGLIREAVQKVFTGLQAADTERRQRDGARIDSVMVGRALEELGLFGVGAEDALMASAQVQAIVALEAGAAALPFPVSEALATHALVFAGAGGAELQANRIGTLSGSACPTDEMPVLEGRTLRGIARLVTFAEVAGHALVEARCGSGTALVDVDLQAAKLMRQVRSTVEPDYPAADLHFDNTAVTLLESGETANCALAGRLRERMSLLAAAEIAGACRRMVSMTREYLLVRSQFDKVLGTNQALKHKLADNHVRVEALAAAVDYAAAASDAGAGDAELSICAAKHFAGRAGKAVADSTLQMHGAIGYTMEFPLHLLMRRVFRLGASHGSGRVVGERLFELFKLAH